MTPRLSLFLVHHYIRKNRVQAGALFGMVLLLTFITAGIAVLRGHVVEALDDSVALSQAGHRYAATATAAGSRTLAAAGYRPVEELKGAAARGSREASVALRLLGHPDAGVPGRLIAGRPVEAVGEVVLSQHLADQLEASLGSQVEVRSGVHNHPTAVVVGITVDPVNPHWDRAVMMGTPGQVGGEDALWLGDEDVGSQNPASSSSDVRVVGVGDAFGDSNANPAIHAMSVLAAAGRVLVVATAVLIAALLTSLRTAGTSTVDGLMAAGASRRAAWSVLHGAWAATAAGGWATALVILAVTQHLGLDWMANLFGQSWHGVLLAWPQSLTVAVVGVLLPLLFSLLRTRRVNQGAGAKTISLRRPAAHAALVRGVLFLGAIALLALLGLTIGVVARTQKTPSPVHGLWLGALVALAIPHAAATWTSRSDGPTAARLIGKVTRQSHVLASTISIALFVSLCWSLTVERMADSTSGQTVSDSALQVVEVPDHQVSQLRSAYAGVGGTVDAFPMVQRLADGEVMAAENVDVKCLARGSDPDEECPDPNLTTIVLDGKDASTVNVPSWWRDSATLSLITAHDDGHLGEPVEVPRNPRGSNRASAASVVLVGRDSVAAHKVGLRASGTSLVVLERYQTLSAIQRAEIRSYLFNVLPTSFPQGNVNSSQMPVLRSLAWTGVLCTGLLGIAVMLLGSISELRAQSRNIRAMQAISPSVAGTLSRKLVRCHVAVGVLVPATGAWASWLSLPHTGQGISWIWLMPVALTIISVPILFHALRHGLKVARL